MHRKPVKHAENSYFKSHGANLLIAGKTVEQVASVAGQTPYYAYDRNIITQKINEFRSAIPERIHLHYAIKANPHPSLVSFVANQVDGLDVASLQELRVALATKTDPKDISFAGPAKSEKDIAGAIAAGIILNIESETELARAVKLAEKLGRQLRAAIRINPDFELKTSGMKMGGGPKQFGIDAERVPEILTNIASMNISFEGFHIYSGSQNLKSEAITEAHNKTFDLVRRLLQDTHLIPNKLNIGGGFGIPYFPGENALDLKPIGANLCELLKQYPEFSNTEIVIELGRFLVGEAGVYVTRVTDKKDSRGHTYLMVDGGLHHHLANSGNFGQVIRKNYPVTIGNKQGYSNNTVSVVGPLCTPLDILADNMELPEADIGDYVVVFQSGAYGPTASPRGFLSQPDLVEVFL
jgi:diaminopimelate decarboxylase